ncbi:transposase [Chryseobacterium sp. WG23]|nr:transposase [Chryseobacterium sp. WG23]
MADIRTTPIEADCFYHIYNRGINGENIFKSDRNYSFFLNKVVEFLIPTCDVYAYCLMPNHFHLLVKIKSDLELSRTSFSPEYFLKTICPTFQFLLPIF